MHFMFAKCCKCLRKISKLTMMNYNLVVRLGLVIEEAVNATMTLLPWSDDKVEMEPDRPRKKEAGFAH
jgi:hypothetical protein